MEPTGSQLTADQYRQIVTAARTAPTNPALPGSWPARRTGTCTLCGQRIEHDQHVANHRTGTGWRVVHTGCKQVADARTA